MAQTLIADFHRGFADIAAAGGNQVGGALNPLPPQPCRQGDPFHLGEGAGQVVRIHAGELGEGLQRRRFIQCGKEGSFDFCHPLHSQPFGAGAKKFAPGGRGSEDFLQQKIGHLRRGQEGAGRLTEVGRQQPLRPDFVHGFQRPGDQRNQWDRPQQHHPEVRRQIRPHRGQIFLQPNLREVQHQTFVLRAGMTSRIRQPPARGGPQTTTWTLAAGPGGCRPSRSKRLHR